MRYKFYLEYDLYHEKKIHIYGEEWTIKFRKRDMSGRDGFCIYEKKEIWIHKDLVGEEVLTTFLHELYHATNRVTSSFQGIQDGAEEIILDQHSIITVKQSDCTFEEY